MNKIFEEMKTQALPDIKTVTELIEKLPEQAEKRRKRFGGAVIAIAAAAVLFGISAAAVISLYHSESVERYISNAGTAAADIKSEPISGENDRFRITLDRTFCDGENVSMIFTVEPLDGEPFFETIERNGETWDNSPKYSVTPELNPDSSFDFGTWVGIDGWHATYTDEDRENNIYRFILWYSANGNGRDILGETYIRFAEFMYVAEPDNPFRDIVLKTDVEKNIGIEKLYAQDGTEAVMSQVGFYIYDYTAELPEPSNVEPSVPDAYFIRNDGTKEEVDVSNWFGVSQSGLFISFKNMIDLDDYKGFELMGIPYLK